MADKLARLLVERERSLRSARSTWDTLWQSVTRYCLPNSATFTETVSAGLERTRAILDSTAPRALEMFASFLHTLLNNPASRWIRLGVEGEPDISKDPTNRAWFELVEKKIIDALVAPEADIYSQLHQVYLDLGAVGTACLFSDVAPSGRLRIRNYHMADCVVAEGEGENIDSMYRQRKTTRRQALQRFGKENLGKKYQDVKGGELDKDVRFLHVCFPSTDPAADEFPTKIKRLKAPFVAAWIDTEDDEKLIETATYEEFPYHVPRWYKARGEIYGRSPAMTVLPDIRMVNRMSDTILRGAEKIVDPPLYLPDGALVSPVRLFPGGMTFTEGNVEIRTLIPPGTSRIETGNELLKNRQQAIKEGFFTPLFVTPDSPVKTATQVLQEVDERNRALSPMLVRIQTELFHLLVTRVYNILDRSGQIPPKPQALAGQTVRLEYVSPLIASQKQVEGLAVSRMFDQMALWAQVDPGIFDWIDTDKTARVIHAASGAPAELARNQTQVTELRAIRAKAQDAQAQAAMLNEAGKTAAPLITAIAKKNAVPGG